MLSLINNHQTVLFSRLNRLIKTLVLLYKRTSLTKGREKTIVNNEKKNKTTTLL